MRVRMTNVPKDLLPISRAAVRFFATNFLHPRTAGRIENIHVCFRKFRKPNEDCLAYCDYIAKPEGRPVRFTLAFNTKYEDIRIREYVLALFHEMVHMRQYSTGELKDLNNGNWRWRGQTIHTDTNYWLLPWEVQAHGMEMSIYQMFVAAHPEFGLLRFKKKYGGRSKSSWKRHQTVPYRLKKTVENQ